MGAFCDIMPMMNTDGCNEDSPLDPPRSLSEAFLTANGCSDGYPALITEFMTEVFRRRMQYISTLVNLALTEMGKGPEEIPEYDFTFDVVSDRWSFGKMVGDHFEVYVFNDGKPFVVETIYNKGAVVIQRIGGNQMDKHEMKDRADYLKAEASVYRKDAADDRIESSNRLRLALMKERIAGLKEAEAHYLTVDGESDGQFEN